MPEIPIVKVAFPDGRPAQLRYFCVARQKEIRISTGTRDPGDVDRQRAELQAQLTLGITPQRRNRRSRKLYGAHMPWDEFRELYRVRYLLERRAKTRRTTESRLNVATLLVKPATLADMATRETLVELRQRLIDRHASLHGAKSALATVLGVLRWAESEGLIERVPTIPKVRTSKLKAMKGRPITGEEFERMLEKTQDVVGAAGADRWRYVQRGIWASALRIGELLMVSWDIPDTITPHWPKRRRPILRIPDHLQKNDTEEEIPLLPWFDELLQETPVDQRTGWVFNPGSVEQRKRPIRTERPSAEWCSRIITRIGEAANVVVEPPKSPGGKAKFASAHDLRRSCADRLVEAKIPEQLIMRVMRHASWETTRRHYAPGQVQREAEQLHELLATT